jgi:hypothetical protein
MTKSKNMKTKKNKETKNLYPGNSRDKTSNTHITGLPVVQQPQEEDIRELAEILYHQRIARDAPGTAEEDWLTAEDFLRNPEV